MLLLIFAWRPGESQAQEIQEVEGTVRELIRSTAEGWSGANPCGAPASGRRNFINNANARDTSLTTSSDSRFLTSPESSTVTYHTFQAPAQGVIQQWVVVYSSAADTFVDQGSPTCGSPGNMEYTLYYSTVAISGPYKFLAQNFDDYSVTRSSVSIPTNVNTAWVRAYACAINGNDCAFDVELGCFSCGAITAQGRMLIQDVRIERTFATGAKKAAPFSD